MAAKGGPLAPIKKRLQGRPDTEHEQALIRIAFAVLIVALLPLLLSHTPAKLFAAGLIGLGSFVASLAIFAAIVIDPRRSPARRIIGMLVDTAGVCAIMLVGGLATALFYPILLWIVFGHGFRFGRRYLFAAAGSSVVQFLGVVWFNPEWRALPGLDASLVIALVVLPAYVSGLLRRLENAIRTAEDASRAKSRFLATMSHEFRTPLNAVIGMGDLLARSRLDSDQREMVTTIGTAAKDLLGLVNEILDFAKIEARRVAVERKPFDLAMCIGQIRGLLVRGAGEKGLYLRLRVAPGTPRALVGGAGALQHVLTNLVANAIKFTSAGGVTISVRTAARTGSRARLHFDVADTGIGIPLEAQRRIFESFEQADEGTGRSFGGTGLGLSIARELVEAMGGGISVASAPGRGSCFSFAVDMDLGEPASAAAVPTGTALLIGSAPSRAALVETLRPCVAELREASSTAELWPLLESTRGHKLVIATGPLTAAEVEAIADAVASRCAGEAIDVVTAWSPARDHEGVTLGDVDPSLPGADETLRTLVAFALAAVEGEAVEVSELPSVHAHVLAADDSPINLRVVARILEHAGHTVTCVRDGEEALAAVEAEPFDVVLLDLNMPRMNGLDTVRMMRFALDPRTMPAVVALTADATAEAVQACRDAGFVDYLTKPIDTPHLLATVARLTLARRGELPQAGTDTPAADSEPLRAVAEEAAGFDHATAQAPVAVDPAKLAMLGSLDTGDGFLDELLGEFLEDAAGTIGRLEAATRDGDPARIRDESHALRSSASNVGARALVERTLTWRNLDDAELIRRCRSDVALLHDDLARVAEGFAAFQADRSGRQLPASPAA